jgi:signal transduction histidine kinase
MKLLYQSLDLKFPQDDPRATDVEIIGHKMDQLNRIVERILDFARNAEPQLAPVNVNQLIEDLSLLTRHKLKNQGIELVRRLAPDLPTVAADATQLEQVFLNLTLNAVEAMTHGGQLTITTRSGLRRERVPRPAMVVIEFQDTGCGMSEAHRRRALESLLGTTKSKGTGLGLAIVQRVVEAHRGQVRIKSRKGLGTTVSLSLPATAPE